MICGIGVDMTTVERFIKWVEKPEMIDRFFNKEEKTSNPNIVFQKEHYAARFAAKEAFSKALGTGISGFELKEVYITHNEEGKPVLNVEGAALALMNKRFGNCNVFVSLSHEKEYAVAFVVLEK